ncbi:MAG: hypothetical protein OEZ59_07150 [Deltaproteobacteria bacterium]|nr:hypothetical protein [Deltaproteobacteria bacterium]
MPVQNIKDHRKPGSTGHGLTTGHCATCRTPVFLPELPGRKLACTVCDAPWQEASEGGVLDPRIAEVA